jgi:hypothetical protein
MISVVISWALDQKFEKLLQQRSFFTHGDILGSIIETANSVATSLILKKFPFQ